MKLLSQVTCPHCWNKFSPADALWVSEHPDLLNDPRLGSDQQQRFLPTRFTLEGAAIDTRGFPCRELACPKCHLVVPRAFFEMPPFFLSILGAPASGKSYFLASMSWQLRQTLPKIFNLNFGDADPLMNHRLQEYESLQFLNPDANSLVAIDKTEEQGDLYDSVLYGDQAISYLRPFVFSLTPMEKHPAYHATRSIARTLCMYDNAGESFLPGQDTASNPVTRHLALSDAMFFLFDPTQDPKFRRACSDKSDDPQMQDCAERSGRESSVRQETILLEAAQRVRRHAGLGQKDKHHRPLIVIVTKHDSWKALMQGKRLLPPWAPTSKEHIQALRFDAIRHVSKLTRDLLWKYSPEIVSAAEDFAEHVTYIPVSATGRGPEVNEQTGALALRPKDINPMWSEVPLLYTMCQHMRGIIPSMPMSKGQAKPNGASASSDGNGASSSAMAPPRQEERWQ